MTTELTATAAPDRRWITRQGSLKLDLGFCVVYTVLIVAGMYIKAASLAAFLLVALAFFCLPLENILGQMLYLMSFAMIFKMSPGSTSFLTYLELYTAVLLLMRHLVLRIREIICMLLLLASMLGGSMYADNLQPLLIVKFFASLLLVACFKMSDHRRQLPNYLVMMAVGLIVSSAVAYLWKNSSVLQQYITFSRVFEYDDTAFKLTKTIRFCGLNSDPNYYAVNLCVAIAGLLILLKNKMIRCRLAVYALVIALVGFGLLTVSKSFLLMLAVILLYMVFSGIRQKRFGLALIVLLAGAVLIVCAAAGKLQVLDLVLERLNMGDNSDALTTGRVGLWERYIEYLTDNPAGLVFGSGMGTAFIGFAAHNTYIEGVASLGFVGLLLFSSLLVFLMKDQVPLHRSFDNFFVLIVLLFMYSFLSMLTWFDFPFQLYLCYCFLNYDLRAPAGK